MKMQRLHLKYFKFHLMSMQLLKIPLIELWMHQKIEIMKGMLRMKTVIMDLILQIMLMMDGLLVLMIIGQEMIVELNQTTNPMMI
ncbi:hypothetical protein WN944_019076 [Citrus x changshan-huyou]|uniref:Uncharacterized protein n=1 Tax=Citrus x changshan-huyou TaxID=2935761 RepID=A0AAP0LV98_9ROSI